MIHTFLNVTDIGKGIIDDSIFIEQGTTRTLLKIATGELLIIEAEQGE